MSCGQHPDDCLVTDYAPHIARARPAKRSGSIRGECPACHKDALEVSPGRTARIVFCCHAHCPQARVRAALLANGVPAGCLPRLSSPATRRPSTAPGRESVRRAAVEELLGLSGAALTLRLACLAWDVPPAEAAGRLKMPERTYRRALTARPNLAGNRRSG